MSLLVDVLRETGVVRIEPLTLEQIGETLDWFDRQPVFHDAHVPQTARNRGEFDPQARDKIDPATECLCCRTEAVILAPYLLEHGLRYTDMAAEYLGVETPVAYSMNAFWTRPGPTAPRWDIQEMHRDADDERFLAMFFFLSDVTDLADGPHQLEGPDGQVRTIYGRRGTAFLADTSHRHMGLKPTRGERGIAWYRYGVSPRPPANEWDKIEPVSSVLLGDRYPTDPHLRESVKLLVACDG